MEGHWLCEAFDPRAYSARQRIPVSLARRFLFREPGALHENTFASVNAVVQRLHPRPEFILFPGDEIIGLTPDADALRAQ
jgi:hypothetical protein